MARYSAYTALLNEYEEGRREMDVLVCDLYQLEITLASPLGQAPDLRPMLMARQVRTKARYVWLQQQQDYRYEALNSWRTLYPNGFPED